jgi:hypothetical protein
MEEDQKNASNGAAGMLSGTTDTTMTTTLSYKNSNKLKRLPPNLPPYKKTQSTNFLFTFSNADEDIIKNAGAASAK